MYAIIKTGGKQYRVAEGDVITIEKLEAAANESVTFEEVLTVVNDGDVKVGAPLVNGAKVTGTVLEHGKGKKILVFKYKAKSNTIEQLIKAIVNRSQKFVLNLSKLNYGFYWNPAE